MEIRAAVKLTSEDMFALYDYIRVSQTEPPAKRINQTILISVAILLVSIIVNIGDMSGFLKTFFISMSIMILVWGLIVIPEFLHKLTLPNVKKSFMNKSPQELEIEGVRNYVLKEDRIEVNTNYGNADILWKDVIGFQETDDYFFFMADGDKGAHVIPLKYFTSEQKKLDFINKFAEVFTKKNN